MQGLFVRRTNRRIDQMRPVRVTYNSFGYAPARVLFEIGDTKVLCAISLQQSVPPFLKGKKSGWLSAEYAMLPTATQTRTQREIVDNKRSGRSVEISRLIGRVLRAIVDLDVLGERTIIVDCDVLQADGGTRTASITAAYLALKAAQDVWLEKHILSAPIITHQIAAISVGLIKDTVLLDVDSSEDMLLDADYNFVLTKEGNIVEIQGTAERQPIAPALFAQMNEYALKAVQQLLETCSTTQNNKDQKAPLFSLKNRLNITV